MQRKDTLIDYSLIHHQDCNEVLVRIENSEYCRKMFEEEFAHNVEVIEQLGEVIIEPVMPLEQLYINE